jgi:hypothetical protein
MEVYNMATCKINGCTNSTNINPKTGKYNILCYKHFKEQQGTSRGPGLATPSKKVTPRPKPAKPKVQLFVLREDTLTINYSGTMRHIPVNRYTRAVKYNEDAVGSSGKHFKFIIDIKQGNISIIRVLIDTKKERDMEFDRLQQLLSTL